MAQAGSNYEKNGGPKSRWTVPLIKLFSTPYFYLKALEVHGISIRNHMWKRNYTARCQHNWNLSLSTQARDILRGWMQQYFGAHRHRTQTYGRVDCMYCTVASAQIMTDAVFIRRF